MYITYTTKCTHIHSYTVRNSYSKYTPNLTSSSIYKQNTNNIFVMFDGTTAACICIPLSRKPKDEDNVTTTQGHSSHSALA